MTAEAVAKTLGGRKECDTTPNNARRTLETLLGPATVVVASGGQWLNDRTGEIECKLHLHWRGTEVAHDRA